MTSSVTRRGFLGMSGGAAAAAFLGACGGSSSSGGDVEYWAAFTQKEHEDYYRKVFVDGYNEGAKAQVRMVVKPVDTIDRLTQTAVAAGKGPDVLQADGPSQALSYHNAGRIVALDSYTEEYGWADRLQAWALDAGRIDGKLYSLPTSYESMALFYNPDVFSERGWRPPKNRAEFEAICTEAKQNEMMPVAVGNAEWKPATEWFVTIFLNHFSGPEAVHEALTGKRKWTDPVFVDAIELLAGYFERGWFGGGVEAYFTNKSDRLYTQLANGKAAMILGGSWQMTEMTPFFGEEAGNDARWEWAPLPQLDERAPATTYELSVGGTLMLNKAAEQPDAVAEWFDYLVSDPKRWTTAFAEAGLAPIPVDVAAEDFPDSTDERLKRYYVAIDEAKVTGYTTWTHWPPKSDTYIYTSMDKVITGKLSPQDYCAGLDETFAKERASGKVPPVPPPEG